MRGRIVKGEGRLVPAVVMTARDEAVQIIARAQDEAARLRADATGAHEQARRDGYEEGVAQGRDAAAAEVAPLLVGARADAEKARQSAKETAMALARKMAEKVVGRAVDLSPEIVADIVAQALGASRARAGTVTLRVSPEDLPAVDSHRQRWAAALPAGVVVHVVGDASVGRHGCIVDTPLGRLDARLDTQLQALEKAVYRR